MRLMEDSHGTRPLTHEEYSSRDTLTKRDRTIHPLRLSWVKLRPEKQEQVATFSENTRTAYRVYPD